MPKQTLIQIRKNLKKLRLRNNADSIVHSTEKSLKEHGSKIPKEDKDKIEKSLEELKVTLKDEKAEVTHFLRKNRRIGSKFNETR